MTPVNIDRLAWELRNHPSEQFVSYLLDGLRNGFDSGIDPLPSDTFECKNNLSATKDPDFVTSELLKEVESGHMAGPFDSAPFDHYRVSPLSVAEHKYTNKKRLVLDLSAPHDSDVPSVNSLIDKDTYSMHYARVDNAIDIIRRLGRGAQMCKFDIKSAFKCLFLKPHLYKYHCVKWNGKIYYWLTLTFGSRSSCAIFTTLSEAIYFIATSNYYKR